MKQKPSEVMVSRLAPVEAASAQEAPRPSGPGFLIEILAADGAVLLRMFERNGRLAVEGDELRWEEGAKRFVHEMMRWSGVVGLRWKDAAIKAAE